MLSPPLSSDRYTGLVTRLEACKNDATSQNIFQELALDIMKLGKSLTDATSFLPAYDQRQCREVCSHIPFVKPV